jgi:hypothetical protein
MVLVRVPVAFLLRLSQMWLAVALGMSAAGLAGMVCPGS